MKITCPNCSTSYQVADGAVGDAGRSVRCVHCRSVWFVSAEEKSVAAPPVAAAPAAVPAPAGGGDLDDMAAWGLTDEEPAAAPAAAAFDPNAMLSEIEGPMSTVDGPPLAPVDAWAVEDDPWSTPTPEKEEVILRPRDRPKPKRKLPRPSLTTVNLALTAVIIGLIGWRADVVRVMPQTASLFAAIGLPVNLRGLALEDIKTTKEQQDGVPVLVVEGRIVNLTRMTMEIPRIRFAMRNSAGAEVYNWTTLPARPVLAPGDAQPFRTRLAAPPAEGKEVVVRFFSRRDAAGGLK